MPYFYLFKVGDERVKVGFGADRSFTHKATCRLGLQVCQCGKIFLIFTHRCVMICIREWFSGRTSASPADCAGLIPVSRYQNSLYVPYGIKLSNTQRWLYGVVCR